MCVGREGCRYNELRDGETTDDTPDNGRIMFVNATDNTTDLSNALALDMTYRVLYYGHENQVGEWRDLTYKGLRTRDRRMVSR